MFSCQVKLLVTLHIHLSGSHTDIDINRGITYQPCTCLVAQTKQPKHHFSICDPAWENRVYVHIKFDLFFGLRNFITFCLNIAYQQNYAASTAKNGQFSAIYRTCISYTGGEIIKIMWMDVFCVHKSYFLMLGHIIAPIFGNP